MFAALINTHKRGVALALFPLGEAEALSQCCSRAAEVLLSCGVAEPIGFLLHPDNGPARRYQSDQSIFSVCSGLTAENLSHLYNDSLGQLGISDTQISVIGVLTGPGSFTGLRLGTAFANGLNFGRLRQLWSIESHSTQVNNIKRSGLHEDFWGESSGDEHDPFAVTLAFGDLHHSLQQWELGHARCVGHLEPLYGRDPTPVIKLRQQKEKLSQ